MINGLTNKTGALTLSRLNIKLNRPEGPIMSDIIDKNYRNNTGENNDFKDLISEYEYDISDIKSGKKIEATILSIEQETIYLQLGGRLDGEIHINEFIDPESLMAGDKVDVYVKGQKKGLYICSASRERAPEDGTDAFTELREAFEDEIPVIGRITGVNKGGFEVLISGSNGFCPFSQIEKNMSENPDSFINKVLKFKVIELDSESDKLVLSRRDLILLEKENRQIEIFDTLSKDKIYNGIVKTVKNYGAFIDIGGIEGLLHLSEISNEKTDDATQIFNPGDEIDVKIKEIDKVNRKIALSRKELLEDPWDGFLKKIKKGDKVPGIVITLKQYGAFVKLLPGIEGLLHISKLGTGKFHKHPKEVLKKGDEIKVWIDDIDMNNKKISLSMEEPKEDYSGELMKIKKETDNTEMDSARKKIGDLFDNALSSKKSNRVT